MIKCIIIEDEPLARDLLKRYIDSTDDLQLLGTADDTGEAHKQINSYKPDLIFLDIKLPDNSGINFYKSLIHKPKVIFTTAYSEFAVEGFELEAVDYLLKPFGYERFLAAVNKLKTQLELDVNDVIIIKEDKKSYRVKLSTIFYIESLGDYVKYHTNEKSYLATDTLKSLESSLPSNFLRIHKSYIVCLDHIEYLEGNRLKVNDQMLPVGYAYRESVSRLFKK